MKNKFDILVIDDEQVVIDSVIKVGRINNYKIDSSNDALIAIEKVKENNYRLIICDIMLPVMNGFQFLEELQNLKVNIPVIMTTGYSTLENAVQSLYKGAIDFIPKPFTFDEMSSTIKRGLHYYELLNNKSSTVVYVSCPSKYFRFGYSCWALEDFNGTVLLGATNLYLKTIDNLKRIELLDLDEKINQAGLLAKFEDEEGDIHNLYSALSGRIIDRNEKLLTNISIIEKDPYFEGWIYRIIPNNFEYEKKLLIPCCSDR
ncbi:response regulator [Rosettibacter firmus]|uniref:response regulator n=1 Tax=Rosettibacter firmus TaxID=3111522 RepID=UPI00336C13EF